MSTTEHHFPWGDAGHRYLISPPYAGVEQILFSLHGTRGTAARQRRTSGLESLADEGVLVCFPEAPSPIEDGREWVHDADVAWLAALIEKVLGEHPIGGDKVVLTGWSGGARMSCRLAADRGDLVAGLVPVGGIRAPRGGVHDGAFPVLAFHGTGDEVNPYAGSGTTRWDESVPEAAAAWAAARGLTVPVDSSEVIDGVDCKTTVYGEPGSLDEVRLVTIPGAPHAWPGARSLDWRGRLLGFRPIPSPSASRAIGELAARLRG